MNENEADEVVQRLVKFAYDAIEAEVGEPIDHAFLKIHDLQLNGNELTVDYDYDPPLKQVIVMRTDLNMRKGKMIAQGAHAALSCIISERTHDTESSSNQAYLSPEEDRWVDEGMTKVCVRADSEEELDEIYRQAGEAGLTVHMVVDAGKTEFDGVPTKTCIAIGPDIVSKIDGITGHLKLL